jgi:hypothetical protein
VLLLDRFETPNIGFNKFCFGPLELVVSIDNYVTFFSTAFRCAFF